MAVFDVEAIGTVTETIYVPETTSPDQAAKNHYVENYYGNYPAVDAVSVEAFDRDDNEARVRIDYSVNHGATADSESELRERLKREDYPDGVELVIRGRS